MDNREIYEWLDNQGYQSEYDETGEYKMYFGIDMPKILNDYHNWRYSLNNPGCDKCGGMMMSISRNNKQCTNCFNTWNNI